MKAAIDLLESRICAAMNAITGLNDCAAVVRQTTEARFGDYQANGVMPVAKKLKLNPRKLAEEVVGRLDVSDMCERPEVAGQGFINLRLKTDFITAKLLEINSDASGRLAIDEIIKPEKVVVDFSGPNIAKQMHVGHLRSTIIGDCICRVLEFLGYEVIRQNHIGDWGLPMGMLIATEQDLKNKGVLERIPPQQYIENGRVISFPAYDTVPICEIEKMYRAANKRYETDPQFAERARKLTYDLQNDDPDVMWYWKRFCFLHISDCYSLYTELNVNLTSKDERRESFYKDMLADVVADLKKKGLAVESDGAVCVFPEGFKNKDGEPLPLIVQKSDGAYLYATTDLAAIRYRVSKLGANKIIYVTDARQSLHFQMIFAVARAAGWVPEDVELIHVMFGSVLGEDGKPLKTRSGENVKLKELLDEAIVRAKAVVEEKNPELPNGKKKEIARAVGIGAVKYADYSNNRTTDYIFSFDKMLAMEGNTAPYMQYAYARIKSIERKAVEKEVDINGELAGIKQLNLTEVDEIELGKHLIRYAEAIESASVDYKPNYLTSYLYDLAQKFSSFYTNCPVLGSDEGKRPTRLLLCDLTAKTIRHGLKELLGIEVVEQM